MIIKTTHSVFMTYILGVWIYVQIVNYSVFMTKYIQIYKNIFSIYDNMIFNCVLRIYDYIFIFPTMYLGFIKIFIQIYNNIIFWICDIIFRCANIKSGYVCLYIFTTIYSGLWQYIKICNRVRNMFWFSKVYSGIMTFYSDLHIQDLWLYTVYVYIDCQRPYFCSILQYNYLRS